MKITKLPRAMDMNSMIREEIERRNSICPFCGETEKYDFSTWVNRTTTAMIHNKRIEDAKGIEKTLVSKTWYGNKYDGEHPLLGFLAFWEPKYHWTVDNYKCYTCGAEWEGDPYPKIEI